jgi:hypothetical protein
MHAAIATAVAVIGATLVLTASALAASQVDPSTVNVTLAPGGSTTVPKTVHTPEIPPNPDIVFLADTTGSMGTAINNVRTNAATIMSQVLAAQPTAQFAAAEYKDFGFGDPFGYRLNQAVTPTTADVNTGMGAWSAAGGGDVPEAQLNALYTLATDSSTGFRTGSSRIVVWFGDSNGHDPSNGHSLADTIAALQAASITVLAIPITAGGNGLDTGGQATAITTATGGSIQPADPNDVASAILAGLSNLPATVTWSASCDTGLTVTLSPLSQTVTSGDDAHFTETISVAANAPAGALDCTVSFSINGQPGGPDFVETVNVNRPPVCTAATAGPDLWPPNHKLSDARSITGVTDPDGNAVSIAITSIFQDEPTNGLGDGDTGPADAQLLGPNSFKVRAERSGLGDGRAYYVNFTATDGAGGSCTGTATLYVPHDQAHDPVGGGQLFNSMP